MSGWSFSLIAFALLLARPVEVVACTTVRWPVPSPLSTAQQLTIDAEWIVRVTPLEYGQGSSNAGIYPLGVPKSVVRFRVDEVLKGANVPKELTIPGNLSEVDDFNDHPPPYHFVRP